MSFLYQKDQFYLLPFLLQKGNRVLEHSLPSSHTGEFWYQRNLQVAYRGVVQLFFPNYLNYSTHQQASLAYIIFHFQGSLSPKITSLVLTMNSNAYYFVNAKSFKPLATLYKHITTVSSFTEIKLMIWSHSFMTHKSRSGSYSWVFTVKICPYVLICTFKYCRQNCMQLFAVPLMNFQCEEASLKSTLKKKEKKFVCFCSFYIK